MLIMRMYALYERSIKVLVLFIVVAVLILVVGCVSLDFSCVYYFTSLKLMTLCQWAMLGGKKAKYLDVQSSIGCNVSLSREK